MLVLGSETIDAFEGDHYAPVKVLSRSLAMELNGRLGELLGREILLSGHLTATDLLLLSYARKGLATKNISREVGLTAEAIDTRFRRMNSKLHTPSRKAAAKLASDYGLI
jgi:DNA-binding NarL/FixJ family response regulator